MSAVFRRILSLWWQSPVWAWWLRLARPLRLTGQLRDPVAGEAGLGQAVIEGRFHRDGNSLDTGPVAPWRIVLEQNDHDGRTWLTSLYGFGWLRDLAALGDDPARRMARRLILAFIDDFGRYEALAWRQDIVARRLFVLMAHAPFVQTGADEDFRSIYRHFLAAQLRHLRFARFWMDNSIGRFDLALTLMAAGIGIEKMRHGLGQGLLIASRAAKTQIHGDGGHISRNPVLHVKVLARLIAIRDLALSAEQPVPNAILSGIDRIAPMIRFFRHGDGRLALFHGGDDGQALRIDDLLARSKAGGKPILNARHSGYQRLEAADTVIIADFGPPPPNFAAHYPHASMLGFELSSGKYRIITQCGPGHGESADWRRGLRSTPAHSTLCFNHQDSAAVMPGNQLSQGRINGRAHVRNVERHEDNGAVWIRASHDGWCRSDGLLHQRQLYLDHTGQHIRGEDRVFADHKNGPAAGAASPLARASGKVVDIRFHLHPAVEVILVDQKDEILLRLPGGPGWRMHASDAKMRVENSIYCGQNGVRRPSHQICLSAQMSGGPLEVTWTLSRL